MTSQEKLVEFIKERAEAIKEAVIREGYIDEETEGEINSILHKLAYDWN